MFGKGLWTILSSGIPDDYDANTENGYTSTPTTYTISSVSDADAFCTRFCRANGYKDSSATLHLGDIIQINDGNANISWYVAGFDVEHNQTAADGTVYDNGYGIALIPTSLNGLGISKWSSSETNTYIGSYVHKTYIPSYMNAFLNVLGEHLVYRNVLLGSAVYNQASSSYTWTKCYGTLLSGMQYYGYNGSYGNTYDIGEANYALPLGDHIPTPGSSWKGGMWSRAIGRVGKQLRVCIFDGNSTASSPNYTTASYNSVYTVYPLIYIR